MDLDPAVFVGSGKINPDLDYSFHFVPPIRQFVKHTHILKVGDKRTAKPMIKIFISKI